MGGAVPPVAKAIGHGQRMQKAKTQPPVTSHTNEPHQQAPLTKRKSRCRPPILARTTGRFPGWGCQAHTPTPLILSTSYRYSQNDSKNSSKQFKAIQNEANQRKIAKRPKRPNFKKPTSNHGGASYCTKRSKTIRKTARNNSKRSKTEQIAAAVGPRLPLCLQPFL